MTWRGAVPLLVLAGMAACRGAAHEAGDEALARDSAGVAIVENSGPGWDADPGVSWRLAAEPDLVIGVERGDAGYEFEDVVGVLLLDDGRLLVADAGAAELRVFDAAGRLLATVGGRGDGPGEYRLINGVGRGPGDTLWVYDFGLRRFTVLDAALAVVRTATLGGELSAVAGVGMLPGGGFVVHEYFSAAGRTSLVEGLRRDPVAVARLHPDGTLRDTLLTLPGRETVITEDGGRAVMNAPVVAHATSVALLGDAVVAGDQERWELRVVDLAGGVRRIVRRAGVDLTLRAEEVRHLLAERLRDVPEGERVAARRHFEGLPVPRTRPAYGDLLVDPDGRLWVAAWAPPGAAPAAWTVLDRDGRLLGDVAMPEGFHLLGVGRDRVAGVHRDALGVERVQLFRLVRPGPA